MSYANDGVYRPGRYEARPTNDGRWYVLTPDGSVHPRLTADGTSPWGTRAHAEQLAARINERRTAAG